MVDSFQTFVHEVIVDCLQTFVHEVIVDSVQTLQVTEIDAIPLQHLGNGR